jgi:hypothetical protein
MIRRSGEIKRQAEYKGLWYDVPFIRVDGFPARNSVHFADIKTTTFLFLIVNGSVRNAKLVMIETSMPLENLRIEGLAKLAAGSTTEYKRLWSSCKTSLGQQ